MALVKGTNSYVTVAEADTYFSETANKGEWSGSSAKEALLITATQMIDDVAWTGVAVTEDQLLGFPRVGEYFDPRLGLVVQMGVAPARVLRATFEQAYHLLLNESISNDTGSLLDVKVSTIEVKQLKDPPRIPSIVSKLLRPLIDNSSGIWWRAN